MGNIIKVILLLMPFLALGQTINNSKSEWDKAYLIKNSISTDQIINLPEPNANSRINSLNIKNAIDKSKNFRGIVKIKFKSGTYKIIEPIIINRSNLILEGNVDSKIEINTKMDYAISFKGSISSEKFVVDNYNEIDNSLNGKFNNKFSNGTILDITISNGSWHKSNQGSNYVGQINEINKKTLKYNFKLQWEFKESSNQCFVQKMNPIRNSGIHNLAIAFGKVKNAKNSKFGTLVNFQFAQNCFIDKVSFKNIVKAGIGIDRCLGIKVSNSSFVGAQFTGGGGFGYGIAIGRHSTNCLILDNSFSGMRHSIVLSNGANYNVIKNNIASNGNAQNNSGLKINVGDIQLHGYFPIANLIEGNTVDRIEADGTWGNNGKNNTIIDNIIKDKISLKSISNTVRSNNLIRGRKEN